ncbi:MAG: Dam family site-specific DNA-(adenine-N6)-methyltransferase [Rhodobacter sp.]|nr:Dam family site-specific DNA-(adenine-N6)-methyltransferase [Paracoccaceae bacterium]MCC0078218.1 Dam family site-specific DNA-(adenine-N6)-methyltransferase [Rhodobacter sp.]
MIDSKIEDIDATADRGTQSVPFLKWAGGKRWLMDRHKDAFPTFSGRYIEPFLGGGSVFFRLQPESAILSDINEDLVNCYVQVRDNPLGVEALLSEHQASHSRDHYYKVRADRPTDPLQAAAWFLYLNRTCWNGLYRVNLKGQFNVPIGTKTKVVAETDDFEGTSKLLKNCTLQSGDFEDSIDLAEDGDLVFVDPPYTVKHNYNGFLKYNETIFSWDDQVRLRDAVSRASRRGAKIVVSNAAHSSVIELYDGLGTQHLIDRSSVLAGKAAARGVFQELLVVIQ